MVVGAKETRIRQYLSDMQNVRYIAKRVFRRRIKIKSGGGKQAKKGRKTECCRLQVATVFYFKRLRCFIFFLLAFPFGESGGEAVDRGRKRKQ